MLCWQCMGLGAVAAGIGAGLSVAVARYRLGFAGGVRELVGSLFSGHPLQGLGLYDALALTLAADLGIVLAFIFGSLIVRTVRSGRDTAASSISSHINRLPTPELT